MANYLQALRVDPQVFQHVRHRLGALARQLQILTRHTNTVGIALDAQPSFGIELQELAEL